MATQQKTLANLRAREKHHQNFLPEIYISKLLQQSCALSLHQSLQVPGMISEAAEQCIQAQVQTEFHKKATQPVMMLKYLPAIKPKQQTIRQEK